MAMKPEPYKLKCPECGYSKIVQLSGDVLRPSDMMQMSITCSKCSSKMEKEEMNLFDKIFNIKF